MCIHSIPVSAVEAPVVDHSHLPVASDQTQRPAEADEPEEELDELEELLDEE